MNLASINTLIIALVKIWFYQHQAYTILAKKDSTEKTAFFMISTGCYNNYNIFSKLMSFSSKATPGIATNVDSFNSFTTGMFKAS